MKITQPRKTNGDIVLYSEGVLIGIVKYIRQGLYEYNGRLYDRKHMALRSLYRENGIEK